MADQKYLEFTRPLPFIVRVVDADFYSKREGSIKFFIDRVIANANRLDRLPTLAMEWAEQMIQLQNENVIPNFEVNFPELCTLGVLVSELEKSEITFSNENTIYLVHCALAAFSMGESPYATAIQSLAVDGAYYLSRSQISPGTLRDQIQAQL